MTQTLDICFSALKIIINRPHLFYGGLYMYWNETVGVSAGVVFDSLTIGNPFLMKFQNKITSNSNIVWIVVIIAFLTSRPQRRFKHSFFKMTVDSNTQIFLVISFVVHIDFIWFLKISSKILLFRKYCARKAVNFYINHHSAWIICLTNHCVSTFLPMGKWNNVL